MICQNTDYRPKWPDQLTSGLRPSVEKIKTKRKAPLQDSNFHSDLMTLHFFVPSDRVDWANCLNVHLMFKIPNPIQIL